MQRFFSVLLTIVLTVSVTGTVAEPLTEYRTVSEAENGEPTRAPLQLPDRFTAVLSRFIGEETAPVLGTDGLWHVVYELWFTNGKQVPAQIDRIEVLDFDTEQVVHVLEGEALLATAFELSTRPAEDTVLEPNESLLIYVELEFESVEEVPDRIVHRLTGTGANNPGSREPVEISYLFSPWDISERTPPVIGPPLAGCGWVVINGCCSDSGAHRGAIQTVNGTLMDSQRYAIDWMRLNRNNRLVEGDPSRVENWVDYGSPVYAVASGTVVEVLDGLPDQPPGQLPDPLTITLETVDGNHVILDLGNGVYAFYAHLKHGSVLVEEGDRVVAGQQIGNLGNSGNTSAPHLHLHLMTAPSAIAADGIPYAFERFWVQGSLDREQWLEAEDLDVVWDLVEEDIPGPHFNELPLDVRVVTFEQMTVDWYNLADWNDCPN
jgi:hypothetical protein